MIAALLIAVAAYLGLRAVDAWSTSRALRVPGAREHDEMARADGTLDTRKFWLRAAMWAGLMVALYVVASFTSPYVHGAWLGLAGVLLVRSVVAIVGNVRIARRVAK